MSLHRLPLASLLAVLMGLSVTISASAKNEPHPVSMQQASAQTGTAPLGSDGNSVRASMASSATNASLEREVFGFALSSSLSDPTIGYPSWDFSLLTTVAYFRLYVNDNGTIANDSGWTVWNSAALTNLVTAAHNAGVKVVVTVDLQDFVGTQPHMCAGLTNRATTISAVASEVAAKGVDGVNLDYEGLNATCPNHLTTRSMMTSLAHDLRTALGAGPYLSVDTYASSAADGAGFFDVASLNAYVDSFFVMAYDLEYSNWSHAPLSCTKFCLGPTAPLTGYYYNDTNTAAQYIAKVGASKVILGVPYYGRKSCVPYPKKNPYPNGAVAADTYMDAVAESSQPQVRPGSFTAHRDVNDPSGMERWDSWFNTDLNCYRVLYWDDTVSLGKKYDLVNKDKLRGVGIWNLNYGGGTAELWSTLYDHFVACDSVGVGSDFASPQSRGRVVTFTATTATGCNNPDYEFWLRSPNGTWTMKRSFSPTTTWVWDTSTYAAGTYMLHVWANQHGGLTNTFQALASMTFVINPSPVCKTATVTPSPVSQPAGSTIAFHATSTQCPFPRYEYWVKLLNGKWYIKRGFSSDPDWSWNTSGLPPGVYYVHVWANQAGDQTARLEAMGESKVTLTGCTGNTVSPATGSGTAGTAVPYTASATGCPDPVYEFWLQDTTGRWHLMGGWGVGTWTWSNTGWGKGTYHLHVWANQQGSYLGKYQVIGTASYTIT
jgi:spore germination protein YaaH